MDYEHTFSSEYKAREAWGELNAYGKQRGNRDTVAFRDGCRVYIRPEFASVALAKRLELLAQAIEED